MLNVKDCLEKANRNKNFALKELAGLSQSYPDWVTVVAFYSALHFVDAYLLAHHGIQREHHEEREREVAIHMRDIYVVYKELYEMAFRSRYHALKDNPTPKDAENVLECDLPEVEEYVMGRMPS